MRSGTECRFRGDGLAMGKLHLIESLCLWSGRRLRIWLAAGAFCKAAAPGWYNSVYVGQIMRFFHLRSTDVRWMDLNKSTSLNRPINVMGDALSDKERCLEVAPVNCVRHGNRRNFCIRVAPTYTYTLKHTGFREILSTSSHSSICLVYKTSHNCSLTELTCMFETSYPIKKNTKTLMFTIVNCSEIPRYYSTFI